MPPPDRPARARRAEPRPADDDRPRRPGVPAWAWALLAGGVMVFALIAAAGVAALWPRLRVEAALPAADDRTRSLEPIALMTHRIVLYESLCHLVGDGGAEPDRRAFEAGPLADLRRRRDAAVDVHRRRWPADRGAAGDLPDGARAAMNVLYARAETAFRELTETERRQRPERAAAIRRQVVDDNPVTLPRITPGLDRSTLKGEYQYEEERRLLPAKQTLAKAEWRARIERLVADRVAADERAGFAATQAAVDAMLDAREADWRAGPR